MTCHAQKRRVADSCRMSLLRWLVSRMSSLPNGQLNEWFHRGQACNSHTPGEIASQWYRCVPSPCRTGFSDGVPGADRRQERGVAPRQIADALLVAGRGVELLAELEMIAVVNDRLQHLVAGAP